MKDRLTNNYGVFIKHIESILSTPHSHDSEIIFSVFPALGSGHFSIQLVGEKNPFLLVKKWEPNLRIENSIGIYNLDAVIIQEQRIGVSYEELFRLRNLIKPDMKVEDLKGIILDGVDFELVLKVSDVFKKYQWRSEIQISEETRALLEGMIKIAGL